MQVEFINPPFRDLSENWLAINNTAFRNLSYDTVDIAKGNIAPDKSGLHNRTGKLRDSIRIKRYVQLSPDSPGHSILAAGNAEVPYAAIHENGGTIRAKSAPFLVFEYKGRWFRKKSVHIPARPYLQPAVDEQIQKYDEYFQEAYDEIVGKL